MNGPAFLLLALALTAAFFDWLAVNQEHKTLEYLCKPLTLALLIACALALDPADEAVRAWFVAALVLSLAGDVFLMLPRDLFVLGLGSFLLGHVAYIVGMHVDGVDGARFMVGIGVVAGLLAGLGTRILRGVRAGPDTGLAGPVVAYMGVISAMLASAIGVGDWVMVVGASLFYVSDALIAWNRFVAETSHSRVAIMVTYHLAQTALVLSLL
ncbi:MAG: lysoplasmalogenase [Acidimicrobiales bacterium]